MFHSDQPTPNRPAQYLLFLLLLNFSGCEPHVSNEKVPAATSDARHEPKAVVDHESPSNGSPLLDDELAEGWIALFDGTTLFGWEQTGEGGWRVAAGSIVADEGGLGFLYTTTTFSDYVLRIDYQCEKETNSGVFLHMPPNPQDPASDCYELNIAPDRNPFPTGSLVGRKKVAAVPARTGWNTYEVTVLAGDITVKLNGESIVDYHDAKPIQRGHIGLQHNQGRIEFRNVMLKPLATNEIFNGRDLTDWRVKPGLASEFTVTPAGYLSVKNGKGQIETVDKYADFVLQLECKTMTPNQNSGVFFRCIPGDLWMGYESQIHNGFSDNDRTKPTDCGTGGIFRRQDARRVVASDGQWFTKTIVADGPHLAVWVNGYQVSDWTDTRPPHANPRQGLRTDAGTIILQGHDPTTDLLFRGFRIGLLRTRLVASE